MMLPPDIQRRLAIYKHLSDADRTQLSEDIYAFTKKEIAEFGEMRHDAYPDVLLRRPPEKRGARQPLAELLRKVTGSTYLNVSGLLARTSRLLGPRKVLARSSHEPLPATDLAAAVRDLSDQEVLAAIAPERAIGFGEMFADAEAAKRLVGSQREARRAG